METFIDDNEIYGSHNCHINALAVIMKHNNLNTNRLYGYNFNVNMAEDNHHFGGNVPYYEMVSFLREEYKLELKEYDFYSVPSNKLVILPLDSYDLPYIENRDEIKIGEQLHYVLAEFSDDELVLIYDPYYRKYHKFEKKLMEKSWGGFSFPIVVFDNNLKNEEFDNVSIKPYLKKYDYKLKYEKFQEELKRIFLFLEENKFENNELFKRYFSCFKSILIIRKQHFEAQNMDASGLASEILESWSKMIKEMCKLSIKKDKSLEKIYEMIDRTLRLEITYLENV